MNKRISTIFALVLSALFLMACSVSGFGLVRGSGKVVNETRQVNGFDRVEIKDGGSLYLIQGTQESLEIEAEDNIMPYVQSRVVNNTLILELDDTVNKSFFTTRPIKYYLTMKDVHGLAISGGGDIETSNITTDTLLTDISGGGNLRIDVLKANSLNVNVSGGGDIDILNGEVPEQNIRVSGGGNYDARDLSSQNVTANVSGGGDLTVWVEGTLDVNVSGGGSVYYYGKPAVNSSISGGGDVIQREK